MKPIKIVQRETNYLGRAEINVMVKNPHYLYIEIKRNPLMNYALVGLTKPTARRLAAALLKIAGEK